MIFFKPFFVLYPFESYGAPLRSALLLKMGIKITQFNVKAQVTVHQGREFNRNIKVHLKLVIKLMTILIQIQENVHEPSMNSFKGYLE